jgi:hypothetical protein
MISRFGFDGRKIDNARRLYAAIRHINVAGGRALEAHERVALLTVPAGLRPFCLLTHVDEADYYFLAAVLPTFGLYCGVCEVKFSRDLEVDLPQDVIDAFNAYEMRSPLQGLGVATRRIDFPSGELGLALCYPKCCSDMDERTKAQDRSMALRQFVEARGGDFVKVKNALAAGETVPNCSTEIREAWDRRFERTRELFPFAVHTACDECLEAGIRSPTGLISQRYEEMTKIAAPDLHKAVLQSCEAFRRTSRFAEQSGARQKPA